MDKTMFAKGIIKAIFDFKFINTIDRKRQMYWKGHIYSKIKQVE
jgi:hypothetical protein